MLQKALGGEIRTLPVKLDYDLGLCATVAPVSCRVLQLKYDTPRLQFLVIS